MRSPNPARCCRSPVSNATRIRTLPIVDVTMAGRAVRDSYFGPRGAGSGTMRRPAIFLLMMLLLSAACSWFDNPAPDEARIVIEGDPGSTIRLVVSTKFVAAVTGLGQTRVEIFESDTVAVTLPYERVYTIENDQRFFVETSRLDADLANLRVQLFADGRREFDEVGALLTGAAYRFVSTYTQMITTDIVGIRSEQPAAVHGAPC